MCQQPCGTCIGNQFNQCITCKSSLFTLKNNLCIKQPTQIIQIICTFLLIVFVLPNLMRKRCVTLMRILDAIQIVAYFKYINGFLANRQNYLYLGMRSWGYWSQGWGLFAIDADLALPVWSIEETMMNKIIRICIIWLGIVTIMLIFGVLTTMGDPQVTFCNYVFKNFPIAICIGFYINVQDMAFIMANAYNSSLVVSSFSSKSHMIQLAVGIIFACVFLIMVIWMYFRINFDFMKELQKTPRKIYAHVYMFFLALDYDLFQTYELTSLPEKQNKIYRYSNLRLIEICKKVAFSFLIVNSLYSANESSSGEIYSILGFVIFFDIVWYVALPYDLKTQKIQLIISILGDTLVIVILMIPTIYSSDLIQMVLCLALFGLGIISGILQNVLDVYKLIPVDLYQTGLSVVIEDKKLLKQLEERRRLQEEHEQMMKQMQSRNKRLQALLEANKNQLNKKPLKEDTLQSLANNQNVSQDLIEPKNNNLLYQGEDYQENTDMNSDDLAEMYKIDQHKRRKLYQFNKKAAFSYSNKVEY